MSAYTEKLADFEFGRVQRIKRVRFPNIGECRNTLSDLVLHVGDKYDIFTLEEPGKTFVMPSSTDFKEFASIKVGDFALLLFDREHGYEGETEDVLVRVINANSLPPSLCKDIFALDSLRKRIRAKTAKLDAEFERIKKVLP